MKMYQYTPLILILLVSWPVGVCAFWLGKLNGKSKLKTLKYTLITLIFVYPYIVGIILQKTGMLVDLYACTILTMALMWLIGILFLHLGVNLNPNYVERRKKLDNANIRF
jgi:hypothetical protein